MRYFKILLLLVAFACTRSLDAERDGFYANETTMAGEMIDIKTGESFLLNPAELLVIDTFLLIKNHMSSDFLFTLLDLKNKRIQYNFGKIGKGPREFTGNFSMHKSNRPRSVELYNLNLKTYIRFSVDQINDSTDYFETIAKVNEAQAKQKFDFNSMDYNLVTIIKNFNDTLFLADGFFAGGNRIGLCNKSGKLIGTFLTYPDNDQNDFDPFFKTMVFPHITRKHPTRNLFVYAYLDSDWLEICSLKDSSVQQVYSHYSYLPNYHEKRKNFLISNEDNKLGNFYLDANGEFIFLQESASTYEEALVGRTAMVSSRTIYVYNWNGAPVQKLKLDFDVYAFAVDESSEFLYALTYTPDPTIVKFQLNVKDWVVKK